VHEGPGRRRGRNGRVVGLRIAVRRPTLRQVGGTLLSFVIAFVGVVGLIFFFEARDRSQLDAATAAFGQPYRGDPPLSRSLKAAVARGNIAVLYRDPRPPAGVTDLTGGAGPNLRRVGLAVLLKRAPRLDAPLVAVSSTRVQRASSADALQGFVDRYLGRVPRKTPK
jgi:hypothetical protein